MYEKYAIAAIRRAVLVCSLLAAQCILLGLTAVRASPTLDEPAHLAAGLYTYEFGTFDLYRVNPPLVKCLAAAPVVAQTPVVDWSEYSVGASARPEWILGRKFVSANPENWRSMLVAARWAVIPLCLMGAYVCYRWASELYGEASGFLALMLWCTSPSILAWGATITPDVGAAALGVLAAYCFWKWLQSSNWLHAVLAGLTLGLAELAKMTWVVLFGLWPVLWLSSNFASRGSGGGDLRMQARQMAGILFVGIYVLNLGYAFEGSFQRLDEYVFVSRSLAGAESVADGGTGGSRFSGTWLGLLPVPFPKNYVSGMDLQKLDFEQGKWSYLNGEWKHGGWWYYYLYALVLKVPLGTWVLFLFAAALTVRGRSPISSAARHDDIVLLVPALVVFVLVSSQTGFSRYLRYVLPCFPFVFIWMSKVARSVELKQWKLVAVVSVALCWSVGSSLSIYPHSMSYFNELAGGPTQGHRYLIDANVDWGQDLFYLEEWLDEHPEARPLYAALNTAIDPRYVGIEAAAPSPGVAPSAMRSDVAGDELGPLPGWHAVSVHRLHDRDGRYAYFLEKFEPTAKVGYSIVIYHITVHDANRVRRQMGLAELRSFQGDCDATSSLL